MKHIAFVSYLKGEVGLFGIIKEGKKSLKRFKCFFESGDAYSYEPLTKDEIQLIEEEDFIYKGITEHSPNGAYMKNKQKFLEKRNKKNNKKKKAE